MAYKFNQIVIVASGSNFKDQRSPRAIRKQVVIAAHEHSQLKRRHQYVADLLGTNRISDGGCLTEVEWAVQKERTCYAGLLYGPPPAARVGRQRTDAQPDFPVIAARGAPRELVPQVYGAIFSQEVSCEKIAL
ncbi:hypothetical protein EVAR_14562_1 [Eumeta japonica]|uniref:Uncharacterized protein n=1 Tax=Eumeta variegata TaxID=151549 RepID=A0A4C1UUD2_EUMVA|nr:hypothetical protein EVAR_14562_1 [Eumeta japonica]